MVGQGNRIWWDREIEWLRLSWSKILMVLLMICFQVFDEHLRCFRFLPRMLLFFQSPSPKVNRGQYPYWSSALTPNTIRPDAGSWGSWGWWKIVSAGLGECSKILQDITNWFCSRFNLLRLYDFQFYDVKTPKYQSFDPWHSKGPRESSQEGLYEKMHPKPRSCHPPHDLKQFFWFKDVLAPPAMSSEAIYLVAVARWRHIDVAMAKPALKILLGGNIT